MSASMAREGGRVELQQSELRAALNIDKMAQWWFSCTTKEETQHLIKKPWAKYQAERMQGVVFPGHDKVRAAIERHLAMDHENRTDGFHPCQDGTAINQQTRSRCKCMGASPPQGAPPGPRTPPAPSDHAESSKTENLPPGFIYIHTPHCSARSFNLDSYGKDRKSDQAFIPNLLTDECPSTG